MTSWRPGTFGQLGLRDVTARHPRGRDAGRGRRAAAPDHDPRGTGLRRHRAHRGVWSYDPATLTCGRRRRLYFRRGGLVLGDHATHLVRDGDRWLVATSTWGDFERRSVAVTLAESTADLLEGEHVLDARRAGAADSRTARPSRRELGPAPGADRRPLARRVRDRAEVLLVPPGPGPRRRAGPPGRLRAGRGGHGPDRHRGHHAGADRRRVAACSRATAPTTRHRAGRVTRSSTCRWQDRRARRAVPHEHPVADTGRTCRRLVLLTFDGTPYGGELPGYGTHGDLIVLRTGHTHAASNRLGPVLPGG